MELILLKATYFEYTTFRALKDELKLNETLFNKKGLCFGCGLTWVETLLNMSARQEVLPMHVESITTMVPGFYIQAHANQRHAIMAADDAYCKAFIEERNINAILNRSSYINEYSAVNSADLLNFIDESYRSNCRQQVGVKSDWGTIFSFQTIPGEAHALAMVSVRGKFYLYDNNCGVYSILNYSGGEDFTATICHHLFRFFGKQFIFSNKMKHTIIKMSLYNGRSS